MTDTMESIPSTNVKIIELYNKIESGSLIISPNFQRKLVWKKQHKYHFIETVLLNYPFPEVYIASSELDVEKIRASEVVVDGQQRLSTIVDYIKSEGDFRFQNRVVKFDNLSTDDKKKFLNYFVSVRDLKNISSDLIKDIFMRINNTEYSLNAIEKVNAQYGDGEFIVFCKQLVDEDFIISETESEAIVDPCFRKKINILLNRTQVFSENDVKRMIDLQLMMTIISTLIESEYFTRNSKVQSYIEQYNGNFERKNDVEKSLKCSIDIISEIGLSSSSYWYSKSNFFTLVIELSSVEFESFNVSMFTEKLIEIEEKSKKYFANIEVDSLTNDEKKYFEYAKEAVNERNARTHRGNFIKTIVKECMS
ncbi:DUF262 domain-containing protein [Marinomonas gallaica]|uniref:DUF262 domain-containing protein n=1 Tax=Marinomonas gallaica TaxID=1806667 RepID=UPI003A93F23B